MFRLSLRSLLAGASIASVALALFVAATPAQAQTAYAISNGTTLISFNLAAPNIVTTIGSFTGAVTSLDGMDFRVTNGLLYGYRRSDNQIVTVNTANASTTFVANPSVAAGTANLGIDFNPVADRLRIVTTTRQNLRIDVATGATIVDSTLTYANGDPTTTAPNINEVAYTNNDTDASTGTQIYYLDTVANTLVTASNANTGPLTTVGALGFDFTENTGFDIYTAGGTNTAYATLQTSNNGVGGAFGLYTINLNTGAATFQGALGSTGVYGLAIAPNAVAAPEPGSMALVGTSLLSVAGLVVRRRRTA